MIIKITPEEGETNIKEVEHTGVKDFFIFGNKQEESGGFVDFHDWSGSHKFLIPNLASFKEMIQCDMIMQASGKLPQQPPQIQDLKLADLPTNLPVEEEAKVEEVEEVEDAEVVIKEDDDPMIVEEDNIISIDGSKE